MIGIYKITSPSGKVYIGQSWDILTRFNQYNKLKGCKSQIALYNSLTKYLSKFHKFEVIHELPSDISQEIMDNFEELYIQLYKNCNISLLNIRNGGSRGKHSIESIEKIRKSKLGNKINLGRKHTKESKLKMSQLKLGKTHINMGKYNKKKIDQYDIAGNFIQTFDSINEASKELNIKRTSISECVNGRNKRAKSYIFKENG